VEGLLKGSGRRGWPEDPNYGDDFLDPHDEVLGVERSRVDLGARCSVPPVKTTSERHQWRIGRELAPGLPEALAPRRPSRPEFPTAGSPAPRRTADPQRPATAGPGLARP